MKHILLLSLLLLSLPIHAQAQDANDTARAVSYFSDAEKDMIRDINLVRTNPQAFIPYVEVYLKEMSKWSGSGMDAINSDGANLISELRTLAPTGLLQPLECIATVAKQHGEACMKIQQLEHVLPGEPDLIQRYQSACGKMIMGGENLTAGDNNSRDALILLLISPGEAPINYGHRHNILNPDWHYVAVSNAGEFGGMRGNWIQDFAE